MKEYRPELESMPKRIAALPVSRGYPVPWFVAWINGAPEFRAADAGKWLKAVRDKLCWVCGHELGKQFTFVLGPMCGINRTTAEPPCHYECAAWSVRNCPFLSKPQMVRRENNMPEDVGQIAGEAILRNPGCSALWVTDDYRLFDDGKGGKLIRVGEAKRIEWWAEGKPATRKQVADSVESGLPILAAMAEDQESMAELMRRKAAIEAVYPAA